MAFIGGVGACKSDGWHELEGVKAGHIVCSKTLKRGEIIMDYFFKNNEGLLGFLRSFCWNYCGGMHLGETKRVRACVTLFFCVTHLIHLVLGTPTMKRWSVGSLFLSFQGLVISVLRYSRWWHVENNQVARAAIIVSLKV